MDAMTLREELKKAFDQGYSFAIFELTTKGLINDYDKLDSKGSEDSGNQTNASSVNL